MLSALLEEDAKLWMWREYVAQNLWMTASLQLAHPSEYPVPSWIELTREPDEEPEPTGEDIYNDLMKRWGGGG